MDQATIGKLSIWLRRIIAAGSILAAAAPLLWLSGDTSRVFIRTMIVQVLIEAIFGAWLLLVAVDRRYRPDWRHPVFLTVAFWSVLLVVLLPFSADPYRSFWSTSSRTMGVVNILHYWAWFIVLASTFREWPEWRRFLASLNLVGLAVDLIAFVQWHGAGPEERIVSTLGNPSYLAAFTLLNVFIALILWAKAELPSRRTFYIFCASAHFVTLILAASRAAVLAAAVCGSIWLFVGIRTWSSRPKKAAASAVVIAALLSAVFSYFWLRSPDGQVWGQNHLPSSIQRMVAAGLSDRPSLWRIAVSGAKEKILFGRGLENYEAVFDRYVEPAGRDLSLLSSWYDRAHDQFLEVLVATGLVGLAAYLSVWVSVFFVLARKRALAGAKERRALIVLALLFSGHLTSVFFSFDMPSSTLVLYAALALAVHLTRDRSEPEKPVQKKRSQLPRLEPASSNELLLSAAILYLLALAPMAYLLNVRPWQELTMYEGGLRLVLDDSRRAVSVLRRALALNTYVTPELRLRLVDDAATLASDPRMEQAAAKELIRLAAAQMEVSVKERPHDYKTLLAAARSRLMSSAINPGDLKVAIALGRAAAAAAPQRSEALEFLGACSLSERDYAGALDLFRQAWSRTGTPRLRGRLAYGMALAYSGLGKGSGALYMLMAATWYGYPTWSDGNMPQMLELIGREVRPDGNRVVDMLDRLAWMASGSPDSLAFLRMRATIFAKSGPADSDRLESALQDVRNVSPRDADDLARELGR